MAIDAAHPGRHRVQPTRRDVADLLTAADEIASAAGYLDWPDIDSGP